MRQPLVAGNWKMTGSRESVAALLSGLKDGFGDTGGVEVVVCPAYVFLPATQDALRGTPIAWGAQDLWIEKSGAFTGDVSGEMLRDFGCRYVIVGHSERRMLHGESSELVAEKFIVAMAAGLVPILCVGETLDGREAGVTEQVVAEQIDAVVRLTGIDAFRQAVVAYEPVWAIGTGRTATPQQAQEVHHFIRQRLASQAPDVAAGVRVLYGGSVKPDNAVELFGQPDIDGGLIGGASLKASDFLSICRAARR
jgi:triosephosphate isomerase (TIM)